MYKINAFHSSTKFLIAKKVLKTASCNLSTRLGFLFDVKDEVKSALQDCQPVVALESTIITHGMPFPQNVQCALEVERIIREQGAVPATIAIIDGKIKVGLDEQEITRLGDTATTKSIKTSRRDLSYVLSKGCNGGTTVSGTMIVADKAGIPIFATGGIGGVHRLGERTFDISADLTELGRTRIAVVSSGVKSILDIPKTLEYLETQGVFVASYSNSKAFPAFYSPESGCNVPYNVTGPGEAASIIHTSKQLNLKSGQLFAVPVPTEQAMDYGYLNAIIEEALDCARRSGVGGKEITPFLLDHVAKATRGKSLTTNMCLVQNNAKVAAEIAVELSKLEKDEMKNVGEQSARMEGQRPFVIGGSVLDRCAVLTSDEKIRLDGRVHHGKITQNPGGVARNICDALGKLQKPPLFLTSIGNDQAGRDIISSLNTKSRDLVQISTLGNSTAECIVIFDSKGECVFIIGDMEVQGELDAKLVKSKEDLIKASPLLVLDGGVTIGGMEVALEIAAKHDVPVLYEPTDVPLSSKPFLTNNKKPLAFITPNFNELLQIARQLQVSPDEEEEEQMRHEHEEDTELSEHAIIRAAKIAKKLVLRGFASNIIVTLGPKGLIIVTNDRPDAKQPLLLQKNYTDSHKVQTNINKINPTNKKNVYIRHYQAPVIPSSEIVNVSGAGDCQVAGLITAMLEGHSEEICMSVGFQAALKSLQSSKTVPDDLFEENHHSPCPFTTVTL